jgi:hypothetical protein
MLNQTQVFCSEGPQYSELAKLTNRRFFYLNSPQSVSPDGKTTVPRPWGRPWKSTSPFNIKTSSKLHSVTKNLQFQPYYV